MKLKRKIPIAIVLAVLAIMASIEYSWLSGKVVAVKKVNNNTLKLIALPTYPIPGFSDGYFYKGELYFRDKLISHAIFRWDSFGAQKHEIIISQNESGYTIGVFVMDGINKFQCSFSAYHGYDWHKISAVANKAL